MFRDCGARAFLAKTELCEIFLHTSTWPLLIVLEAGGGLRFLRTLANGNLGTEGKEPVGHQEWMLTQTDGGGEPGGPQEEETRAVDWFIEKGSV